MARLPRFDAPGVWFHVMNRGIARRVVVPDLGHGRALLAALAWEVHRGDLEIHGYCLLPTHFHLLVRSPSGVLSKALGRAFNRYVRWVNRRARRDGSLFRGRFRSRPILSVRYRDVVLRYIEANPGAARLVRGTDRYPHASAAAHARPRRPRWLATWWTDEVLARVRRLDPRATYDSIWGCGVTATERGLVHERCRRPPTTVDDLDDLVGAAPPAVRAWMERKARLADGGSAQTPLVAPALVLAQVAAARAREGPWTGSTTSGPQADLWKVAACGLLLELTGETIRGCARRLELSPARAVGLRDRHRAERADEVYAARFATLATQCLRRAHAPVPWEGIRFERRPQSAPTAEVERGPRRRHRASGGGNP